MIIIINIIVIPELFKNSFKKLLQIIYFTFKYNEKTNINILLKNNK